MTQGQSEAKKWLENPEEAFLEWAHHANYSEKTKNAYVRIFLKYIEFLKSKNLTLKSSNKTVYRQFASHIAKSTISKKIYSRQLSSVFEYLIEIDLVDDNFPKLYLSSEKGRSERKLPSVLTRHEEGVFVKNIIEGRTWLSFRERTILLLILGTGLRCSEVSGLRIENIHMEEPAKLRVLGKGRKEREIPIPDQICDVLDQFLEVRIKYKKRGDFLFGDRHGNPVRGATIYEMVRRTLSRAGIVKPNMGPHLLRHTFATRQFEAGIPPAIIKNWMGHSSLATTLIYEHVSVSGSGIKPAMGL